jgi:hypothetical protein
VPQAPQLLQAQPLSGAVGFLPKQLVGAPVDKTNLHDPELRAALTSLHNVLNISGDDLLDSESRRDLSGERCGPPGPAAGSSPPIRATPSPPAQAVLGRPPARAVSLEQAALLFGRLAPHLCAKRHRPRSALAPIAYGMGRRTEAVPGPEADRLPTRGGRNDPQFLRPMPPHRHFRRHTSVSLAAARQLSVTKRGRPSRGDSA